MASSNPFRKKGPQASGRFPTVSQLDTSSSSATSTTASSPQPPHTSFRTYESATDDLASNKKKTKIVKKVRVLSPPPLSPDSPEWPRNAVPDPGAVTGEGIFGSNGVNVNDEYSDDTRAQAQAQVQAQQQDSMPPNPFSKTLQDLGDAKKEEEMKEERKQEGDALKAARNKARASYDVNAFHRLLMTGKAGGAEGLGINPSETKADAVQGVTEGAGSQFIDHLEGTPEEMSDSSMLVQAGDRKKAPPPPPSSRHGRSIRDESRAQESSNASTHSPEQPIRQNLEGDGEYLHHHISRETPDQETPGSKKAAPAPPPRRGHSRGESKNFGGPPSPTVLRSLRDDDASFASFASSTDSLPMRSNSVRNQAGAPAPPPPRRPHHGHGQKPVSLQPSPTSATFPNLPYTYTPSQPATETGTPVQSSDAELAVNHDSQVGQTVKLAAPPPPPARNSSVRRPASIISVEAPSASRMVSGESRSRDVLPPPPPPARKRGSSKSSMDGPPAIRPGGDSSSAPRSVPSLPEEPAAQEEPGHGDAILADLDALQREVDALRGKLG